MMLRMGRASRKIAITVLIGALALLPAPARADDEHESTFWT